MIISCKGVARSGKTATIIAIVGKLVRDYGWDWSQVVSNVTLLVPEAQGKYLLLNNEQMRDYIKKMVENEYREKIIIIDEIDSIFPARKAFDKEQIAILTGLWQAAKCRNIILYTEHVGGSVVDLMIRDSTDISFVPHYSKETDTIYLYMNRLKDRKGLIRKCIYPASKVFEMYWTGELQKVKNKR
jgi:hypothetical protein